MTKPIGGRAKPCACLSEDGIAAPAEVAEGDILVRVEGSEQRLPVAIELLALDERVADEDDTVAVAELELGGRRQRHCDETDAAGDRELQSALHQLLPKCGMNRPAVRTKFGGIIKLG